MDKPFFRASFHPDMQLWYRIGEAGQIFRGTRSSHTFTADRAGRLFLGNYFPGEWSTRTGAISVGADSYRAMEGSLGVQVIRWACEPLDGLEKLIEIGDVAALIVMEIDRIKHGVVPPLGWEYLWFLGPSEIYSAGQLDDERDSRVVAPPTKVVRVWLIANTMFRQKEGRCEFGAIELTSDDAVVVVN